MSRINVFTDVLSYENNVSAMIRNLSEYSLFFKELIDFLGLNIDDYKDAEIDTEVALKIEKKDYGRIDIIIYDKEGNEYLIENKITRIRGMTKNQTEDNYIRYINNNEKAKKLIYLVPKAYNSIETLKASQEKSSDIVTIKFWEDLVKHYKRSQSYELNQLIKEFIDFLDDWFEIVEITFSDDEINIIMHKKEIKMHDGKIAKIMKDLTKIVDDVLGEFKHTRSKYEGYGYEIKNSVYGIDDNLLIWFGIDYDVWEEKGFPLVIWVEDKDSSNSEALEKHMESMGFERYIYENYDVFIFLFKDLKNKNITDEIVTKLKEVLVNLKDFKINK